MYLVMQETEAQPYKDCLIKRRAAERKKKPACVSKNKKKKLKKICQRGEDKKKWREILSEREGRAQHAWATPWDQVANISETLAEANQHPSPERVRDSFHTPRPNFISYLLLYFSPATCQWERKWMNERKKEVEKSGSGPAAEQWGWRWKWKWKKKKKKNRKKMKHKWTNSAGEATQRIHLRAGLYPVCVSMEMGLLSVRLCTNWQ